MQRGSNHNMKCIIIDEPVRSFLASLKSERIRAGLTQQKVAEYLQTVRSNISAYEQGINLPPLHTLIKLAELYDYDISESLNYKFFYRKIQPYMIKYHLGKYGLSYSKLSELTGYTEDKISEAVRMKPRGSIICLKAVLDVIEQERIAYKFRRRLLMKKKPSRSPKT